MQFPRLLIIQTTLGVIPRHNSALGGHRCTGTRLCPNDSTNKPLGICLVLFSIGEGIILELYCLGLFTH